MNKVNYTSIKSVLYELANTLPEYAQDETRFLEWATIGYRKLNLNSAYEVNIAILPLVFHTAQMPNDAVHLLQIAYDDSECCDEADLDYFKDIMNLEGVEWNPAMAHMEYPEALPNAALKTLKTVLGSPWKPMRLTSNFFHKDNMVTPSIYDNSIYRNVCPHCLHEYSVSKNGCITSTLPNGVVIVSYLRYICDLDGTTLIPNNEDVKEAIRHYVLYRYWEVKYNIKEDGAERRMQYNLDRFSTLRMKSKSVDMPTLDEMENIKNYRDQLNPSTNQWGDFFSRLNQPEEDSPFYHRPGTYLKRHS